MKISLVCMPATITPARKMPGRSLSNVSGLIRGFCDSGSRRMPIDSQELQVGTITGHGENKIVR